MPSSSWPRCSFVAEAAGDHREATAPPAEQWFLVEHPGPWGRDAPAGSRLAPAAVTALSRWVGLSRGRVLLIRPSGRPTPTGSRRWFRVDSRPGQESIRTGLFRHDAELGYAVDATGEGYLGRLHLVCAHGRHDTCCAVRGRPLAAALVRAAGTTGTGPASVWECSHLGGCRFAPTMVLLPHGFVLGGVPAEQAGQVVHSYREGSLLPQYLRGRSSLPPAVQAAQHHARLATGLADVEALQPLEVRADGAVWTVSLTDPDCRITLLQGERPAGRPLTCAATQPGLLRSFSLLELTVF